MASGSGQPDDMWMGTAVVAQPTQWQLATCGSFLSLTHPGAEGMSTKRINHPFGTEFQWSVNL